jgi:hypothetical protein
MVRHMATTPALLDQFEVAWAAGIIDGEGGTYCQVKQERWAHLKMQVGQTGLGEEPPEMLTRLQRLLGGTINGPYVRDGVKRPVWHWRLFGNERVLAAHQVLRPFMCQEKREQADEAFAKWKEYH